MTTTSFFPALIVTNPEWVEPSSLGKLKLKEEDLSVVTTAEQLPIGKGFKVLATAVTVTEIDRFKTVFRNLGIL